MLESRKIELRRSEIRQQLAELSAKPEPTEEEVRSMESLDGEYRTAEVRFRAAVVSEDEERKEAGTELETREGKEWAKLELEYEVRQAIVNVQDGTPMQGVNAEIDQEFRSKFNPEGPMIPVAALLNPLEVRAGETTSSTVPDPIRTRSPIDLLYAPTAANAMGVQFIQIDHGLVEYPVASQACQVGWADGETGSVGAPREIQMNDSKLSPDHNLGAQVTFTRKSLAQSGQALEQFARRDLRAAITAEVDRAIFIGSGTSGELTGLITGASGFGFNETAVDAAATFANLRDEASAFLASYAAGDHSNVRLLVRNEIIDSLEDQLYSSTAVSHLDRLRAKLGLVKGTSSALAAPSGSPNESSGIMTVSSHGVPPAFFGQWGGITLLRDPYSGAASGSLTVTALMTCDLAASRPSQVRVVTELQ